MRICVIGTGYVGLVTGVVFADLGNQVVCVDRDEAKIAMLCRGEMPIYEPGLGEMVSRNVEDCRLAFTCDAHKAVTQASVVFICVGTPAGPDGESDLSQVIDAAKCIAASLDRYKIVVNKSTVPVGTGDLVRDIICDARPSEVDFDVVSNPEFLREGSAIHDTLYPDRIIIGSHSQRARRQIMELYAPLERPMIMTDVASAEVIKYASNAFLATKISFINSVANLCDLAGADVVQVIKGMGSDHRISPEFLNAGLGYGGSCFPKDTLSLIHTSDSLGYDFHLLRSVVRVNDEQVERVIERLSDAVGGLAGRTVTVFGLAFKPNTDDLREARSVDVIRRLIAGSARVRAYDPVAMGKARAYFPDITYCENPYEAAEGADAVIVVTEWNEFKQLNLERLKRCMKGDVLFDGRNIYDPDRLRKLGFEYYGVGRALKA